MEIQVLEKDIEEGFRRSCENCPVALAIFRETLCPVSVGLKEITLQFSPTFVRDFDTPQPVAAFIERFDRTGRGNPFVFELPI